MNNNNQEYKKIAIEAAKEAGKIIMQSFNKEKQISTKTKHIDLVTEVDIASEKKIIEIITKHFSEHSILTEESKELMRRSSNFKWIIDPIDGTTNYAHNFPQFCVSIALEKDNKIILGVVFDPFKQEMFTAELGKGAFLNNNQIKVSIIKELSKSLIATGFPYYRQKEADRLMKLYADVMTHAQGVRRAGSAALDLCYVACGRLDGFWEEGLKPWDTAAGSLILTESGGKITTYENSEWTINSANLIATNNQIHNQLSEVIQ